MEPLEKLLERLGSEFTDCGYAKTNMPLVTLDEFMAGNTDEASFQGANLATMRSVLTALLARSEVFDVRIGVTQWEGGDSWPLGEYIYVVHHLSTAHVAKTLRNGGIDFDDHGDNTNEYENRKREQLTIPDGYQLFWAWVD